MCPQTPSGDRLVEWARLVDEEVPEDVREDRRYDR